LSMSKRDIRDYLENILDAIKDIKEILQDVKNFRE